MNFTRDLEDSMIAGDVERVRNILQENGVNLREPAYHHLLWDAIFQNSFPIIEWLIRVGADLAAEDPLHDGEGPGYSILHELMYKSEGDEEYVRLALLAIEHGADVNARDHNNESVLQLAVTMPRLKEVVKVLLNKGAQVDNDNLRYLLEDAAIVDVQAVETLPLLIALNDPSVEVRNQRIITAIVAQFNSTEYNFHAFEELFEMVVDVNQHGLDGFTLLAAAAYKGRLDAVKVLLSRGADIHKKTTQGMLPVYAASMSNESAVTQLLISVGASIYDRNEDGQYPVHGACFSKTVDNLHFLLSHGASINVTDYNNQYPIHIACTKMRKRIVHTLLSLGTSINVVDVNGKTPVSFIHPDTIRSVYYLLTKEFAFLHITTGAVSQNDLTIIEANPHMFRFYQRCYNELQIMSQTVVFENLNLLSVLATSTNKLSAYLRNTELGVAIVTCIKKQHAQFPTYFKQLVRALQIARRKRDIIQNMENVLEESFPVAIPYLVMQKITHYALFEELIRLELDFYSSLYKRIEAQELEFIASVMTLNDEV